MNNMYRKRILYIGGFELPDGNAAAQRVLSIAKSLKDEYAISFLGITHGDNYSGSVDGFEYINLPYPATKKEWLAHLQGDKELKYIKEHKPDIVVCYNFPAWGLYRVQKYCRRNNIKIVGDITEWYQPHNLLKQIDTEWRMKRLNFQMDGLIVISRYLEDYYEGRKMVRIPPTVDLRDKKWSIDNPEKKFAECINLMYAGSPGRGDKDRLENLVRTIGGYEHLKLDVVGVTEDWFCEEFPEVFIPKNVMFHGRLPHEKVISMLCESDFSVFFRQPSRANNAGFPTKFAEAQTAGIPVISSKFSDLEDYVVEGENGFLANGIEKEDIDAVLARVASLDRNDIEEMHSYTREHRVFDLQRYNNSLRLFFESILRQ